MAATIENVWNASWLASLPALERLRWIQNLTQEDAARVLYDWEFWARPEQLPPLGDWFVWFLRSGRGFGKTRTGAEWVRKRERQGFRRIALVGKTKGDVRDTMVEVGDSALLSVCPPWNRPRYEPSKRRLTWPSGAMAMIYSGDEPDQLRGPQHDSAWVDEFAKFKYPRETWHNLLLGMRIGPKPQVAVTTTPRAIRIIKDILARATTIDVQRSSYDNILNLSPTYIREVIDPLAGTRLGRQEINGEILEDNPEALWRRDLIEDLKVIQAPDLVRIVVGVDPSLTSKETSHEAGIVVAGIGEDGHGYVLDDRSLRGSPYQWGSRAVAAYHVHKADRIVAEVNNGGDLVEQNVRMVDDSVAYKAVYASRGKRTRAEPISTLYERKLVHHVGSFPELEDEQCQWVPGGPSPNRLDALVWALTELMVKAKTKTPVAAPVSVVGESIWRM